MRMCGQVVAGTKQDKSTWRLGLSKDDQALFDASCVAIRALVKNACSQEGNCGDDSSRSLEVGTRSPQRGHTGAAG